MQKTLLICLMALCCCYLAAAQPTRLYQTLKHYNEPQKRLLTKNMGRFIYMVFQGQWDLDSSVQYACHVYGINRQFPYDEMIYDPGLQQEVEWLQQRAPERVAAVAAQASGERKTRLLLELVIYYLHQTGKDSADLDNAKKYLTAARTAGTTERWKTECDALQGELLYQQGMMDEGEKLFAAVANRFAPKEISQRKAMAFHQWALHLPFSDTLRLQYLEKAFHDYQQLGLKEQAIEVLSDIVTYNFIIDYRLAIPKLAEVIALEQATGYRHTMDNYFVRSYIHTVGSDYIPALNDVDSCMAVMTETGDSLLYSMVCARRGSVYEFFAEDAKAYEWFRKGIARMNLEPQEFWYKNFTQMTTSLAFDSSGGKALSWMRTIVARYPPQGGMDKISIDYGTGYCYEKMGQMKDAERYYTKVLDAISGFPPEHVNGSILMFYLVIGRFYVNQQQYIKGRQLLEKGLALSKGNDFIHFYQKTYQLLSKLDAIDGNYKAAYEHQQQFKFYSDSMFNLRQRFQMQELNVQYETTKKDQDIKFLTQEGLLKESDLQQARLTRNIVIGSLALLALMAGLLYNQFRVKQRSARAIGQKNKALQQLVDEKQWLLKEVHHRVKNNLQTIVSLLELQSNYGQNDPLSAIQASQNRIYATSLLHQKLYQDDNKSSVDMRVYLPELINYLQDAFETRQKIRFETVVDSIDLDISQAVPIGIIVNETVTNAIKHAFPREILHPAIIITLSMTDKVQAVLQVADNGVGMPAVRKQQGLGLELVYGLAEDLNGTVEITSSEGTTMTIRFTPKRDLSKEYGNRHGNGEPERMSTLTI
ncbi:sensor histidine kinase [Paraflavitalea sp. CAU 1676]|uniref:sensor histidine kinase n=1 Tax=Paraflavitalea sp. CAU 1676 TaxID=3032598 RepID=UPI0023D9A0F5|nr:sensor histidine kinase [Paraflavitalea sp. CAU 1676]MDF2189851.1 sensor histidine kinase [Paraflavitalea sp. CAU 1676]